VADIRLVIADVAKLEERIGGLTTAVEKLGPAFEKALEKHAAEVKERIGDIKTDAKETRDKLDLVRTDIATFKGAMRFAAAIYALGSAVFTALLVVLLTWLLRPTTPPQTPAQPAVAAPSQAAPAGPKNEAAAATPSG
jgi:hypothetical protein